jgi:hypothetical protein
MDKEYLVKIIGKKVHIWDLKSHKKIMIKYVKFPELAYYVVTQGERKVYKTRRGITYYEVEGHQVKLSQHELLKLLPEELFQDNIKIRKFILQ